MRRDRSGSLRIGRWALSAALCAACLAASMRAQDTTMNTLAERYVRLVLAVGQHDADYVDAYYGPATWRTEAEAQKLPLAEIASRASALAQAIAAAQPAANAPELSQLRHQYLSRQTEALRAKVSMLAGTSLRFDEESKALYDAVAPTHTEADFETVLKQLDARLPGREAMEQQSLLHWRKHVIVCQFHQVIKNILIPLKSIPARRRCVVGRRPKSFAGKIPQRRKNSLRPAGGLAGIFPIMFPSWDVLTIGHVGQRRH